MEENLFAILSDRPIFSSHYILGISNILAHYLSPSVNTNLSVGYGQPSLFEAYPIDHPLLWKIKSLLPTPEYFDHSIDRINENDIYSLQNLFQDAAVMTYRYHGDRSAKTKGYAFRVEYSLKNNRDISKEAESMLEYIVQVLSNGELKDKCEKKEEQQRLKEKEEEETEKQYLLQQKRVYDDEHLPKYMTIKERGENIAIPKRKNDALLVNPSDFHALIYAIEPFPYDNYPSHKGFLFDNCYKDHPILVWMPNSILHIVDTVTKYKATMRFIK